MKVEEIKIQLLLDKKDPTDMTGGHIGENQLKQKEMELRNSIQNFCASDRLSRNSINSRKD